MIRLAVVPGTALPDDSLERQYPTAPETSSRCAPSSRSMKTYVRYFPTGVISQIESPD